MLTRGPSFFTCCLLVFVVVALGFSMFAGLVPGGAPGAGAVVGPAMGAAAPNQRTMVRPVPNIRPASPIDRVAENEVDEEIRLILHDNNINTVQLLISVHPSTIVFYQDTPHGMEAHLNLLKTRAAALQGVVQAQIPQPLVNQFGNKYFENVSYETKERIRVRVGHPAVGGAKANVEIKDCLAKNKQTGSYYKMAVNALLRTLLWIGLLLPDEYHTLDATIIKKWERSNDALMMSGIQELFNDWIVIGGNFFAYFNNNFHSFYKTSSQPSSSSAAGGESSDSDGSSADKKKKKKTRRRRSLRSPRRSLASVSVGVIKVTAIAVTSAILLTVIRRS